MDDIGNLEIAWYVDVYIYVFEESPLASKLCGDGAVLPAGFARPRLAREREGERCVASLRPMLCFENLRAIAMPVPIS